MLETYQLRSCKRESDAASQIVLSGPEALRAHQNGTEYARAVRDRWRKIILQITKFGVDVAGFGNNMRPEAQRIYDAYIKRRLKDEEAGTRGKTSTSQHIKRYLIATRGEKCARCGWCERNPATGNIPIELEHIDGQWNNNRPENLILLCPNCHALTPTFRNLNKGHGRLSRVGSAATASHL